MRMFFIDSRASLWMLWWWASKWRQKIIVVLLVSKLCGWKLFSVGNFIKLREIWGKFLPSKKENERLNEERKKREEIMNDKRGNERANRVANAFTPVRCEFQILPIRGLSTLPIHQPVAADSIINNIFQCPIFRNVSCLTYWKLADYWFINLVNILW